MPPKGNSPGKRSRTGCLTCRERKLKCDEKKPVCGHCSKTGRSCQPSSGIVFRHHQNASMNGSLGDSEEDDLGRFYAYKDTFTKDNFWLPINGPVKFIHIKDPYAEDEIMLDLDQLDASSLGSSSLPTLSDLHEESGSSPENAAAVAAAAANPTTRISPPQLRAVPDRPGFAQGIRPRPVSTFAPAVSSPLSNNVSTSAVQSPSPPVLSVTHTHSFSNGSSVDLSRLTAISHESSPLPWNESPARSNLSTPREISRRLVEPVETNVEVLFLLRHFASGVGFSMDLFDFGRFFSDYVPTRALHNPLLKNAACAYAAKQLARVGGFKNAFSSIFTPLARTEYWPNPEFVDWQKCANRYYDEAIRLILQAVDLVNRDKDAGEGWHEDMAKAGTSDDLMAATAILCEYEAIDASGEAWQRHLNGAKSLIDIAEAGMKPLDHIAISQRRPRFSRARRAIFWNFARQDFAAALIAESPARLDVNNHQLWRDAGLELDASGRLIPNEGMWIEYSEGGVAMREDMIANGLILILSKICNYMASAESLVLPPVGMSARKLDNINGSVPYYGVSQQVLLQRWNALADELAAWHTHLPDTFKPIGRSSSAYAPFQEMWYGIDMCASSMANYHMARILLLLNKPQESTMTRSTVSSRLESYRNIIPEVERHSREIVGIALSRPETAVRIFLILPLFYAGQCFTAIEERRTVIDMLQGIEKDLGWTTDYRVKQLLQIWQVSEDELMGGSAFLRAGFEMQL